MSSQTLVLSPEKIKEMATYYQHYMQSPVPYSIFRAKKTSLSLPRIKVVKFFFKVMVPKMKPLFGELPVKKHPRQKPLPLVIYLMILLIGRSLGVMK